MHDEVFRRNPHVSVLLGFGSPEIVEVLAHTGYQSVMMDLQHGGFGREALPGLLRAADAAGVATLVRVPENRPPEILQALDAGAAGVLVPMVNSADEASAAVRACRYPPHGVRSFAIGRGSRHGVGIGSQEHAASALHSFVAVQVETAAALERTAEIAGVDGVDMVLVGPNDLAADLGHLGEQDHPDVQAAFAQVSQTVRRAGKIAGIFCSGRDAAQMRAMGYTFLLTGGSGIVIQGARTVYQEMLAQ